MELFLRGGSAAQIFALPANAEAITLTPVVQ
jgi:hypothetical protein